MAQIFGDRAEANEIKGVILYQIPNGEMEAEYDLCRDWYGCKYRVLLFGIASSVPYFKYALCLYIKRWSVYVPCMMSIRLV